MQKKSPAMTDVLFVAHDVILEIGGKKIAVMGEGGRDSRNRQGRDMWTRTICGQK